MLADALPPTMDLGIKSTKRGMLEYTLPLLFNPTLMISRCGIRPRYLVRGCNMSQCLLITLANHSCLSPTTQRPHYVAITELCAPPLPASLTPIYRTKARPLSKQGIPTYWRAGLGLLLRPTWNNIATLPSPLTITFGQPTILYVANHNRLTVHLRLKFTPPPLIFIETLNRCRSPFHHSISPSVPPVRSIPISASSLVLALLKCWFFHDKVSIFVYCRPVTSFL